MMDEIGERLVWHYVPFTNIPIPFGGVSVDTVANTLLAMVVLWGALWLCVRRLSWVPGRAQAAVEAFVSSFDQIVHDALNPREKGEHRRYLPLIAVLFLFIFACNSLPLLPLPHVEEPTSDLNCTLALGSMTVVYSNYCGVRRHGARGRLREMLGPFWAHEGPLTAGAVIGKLSGVFFFLPMAVVENLSRVVSISCRLFGNITGAAIVIVVLGSLTYEMFTPMFLDVFLLVFESAVQAFVFAMLALVYLAINLEEQGG